MARFLLSFVLFAAFAGFALQQVLLPLWRGDSLFPFFRRRAQERIKRAQQKLENALIENEAAELNLETHTINKKTKNIKKKISGGNR